MLELLGFFMESVGHQIVFFTIVAIVYLYRADRSRRYYEWIACFLLASIFDALLQLSIGASFWKAIPSIAVVIGLPALAAIIGMEIGGLLFGPKQASRSAADQSGDDL